MTIDDGSRFRSACSPIRALLLSATTPSCWQCSKSCSVVPCSLVAATSAGLTMLDALHQTTPPHQDHWYTGGTTNLWTVWIALTEIPLALGPLAVLPGSHVKGLVPHDGQGAGRQGVQVIEDEQFAAAPLAAGDAIVFNCLTVHRALPNVTRDRVRLSVDYRYQPANEPIHVVRVDGTRAGEWGSA
jgi:ectoine hydroxylase-related dioxygenase (phytanoyl-CoA dioxygenase family)